MNSRLHSILTALADRIAAAGYPAGANYGQEIELADTDRLRVDVMPGAILGGAPDTTLAREARGVTRWSYAVAVGIRQRLNGPRPEAIAIALEATDAIAELIMDARLAAAGNAKVSDITFAPYVSGRGLEEPDGNPHGVHVRAGCGQVGQPHEPLVAKVRIAVGIVDIVVRIEREQRFFGTTWGAAQQRCFDLAIRARPGNAVGPFGPQVPA